MQPIFTESEQLCDEIMYEAKPPPLARFISNKLFPTRPSIHFEIAKAFLFVSDHANSTIAIVVVLL